MTLNRSSISAFAGFVLSVGLVGAASAGPASAPNDVHGGPKPRYHGTDCNLTDTSKLPGNWTHGDYVSAVAASGDETKIRAAAHSRCGKPMHAGGPKGDKAARKAAKDKAKANRTPDAKPRGDDKAKPPPSPQPRATASIAPEPTPALPTTTPEPSGDPVPAPSESPAPAPPDETT